jgi:hypothetical protein
LPILPVLNCEPFPAFHHAAQPDAMDEEIPATAFSLVAAVRHDR